MPSSDNDWLVVKFLVPTDILCPKNIRVKKQTIINPTNNNFPNTELMAMKYVNINVAMCTEQHK